MDERECVFDWEANGLNDGFRYPHQIAIIDNDNESICNTYNMRLPHYELPGPIALYKTNTKWRKTKEDLFFFSTTYDYFIFNQSI